MRNPEYDITSSIKKVLLSYQGSGNVFNALSDPVHFVGYVSNDETLPQQLIALKNALISCLSDLKKKSDGKFTFELKDPSSDPEMAKKIEKEFGFKSIPAGLLDPRKFWFYMTLSSKDQTVQVPLSEDLSQGGLERTITASLKRYAKGFLKTVGVVAPKPAMPQYGMEGSDKHFQLLQQELSGEFAVKPLMLEGGIPEDVDLLLLISPESLNEKQVFAVDQFLMQGGTVILSSSPYDIDMSKALSCHSAKSGLEEWLKHHGINFEEGIVLDKQSSTFPIPVTRTVNGFEIIETVMAPYPYFADIRGAGLDDKSGLIAGLNQVTVNWATPVAVDKDKNKDRKVSTLLKTSAQSWTSKNLNIQPNFQKYGELGFKDPDPQEMKSRVIAVALEGKFQSFYKGKESPMKSGGEAADKQKADLVNVLEKSPGSAKIILFASTTFLSDEMLQLASAGMGTRYLNPIALVQNAIDWSLDDRDLLSIRGRAQFSRTLRPIGEEGHVFWEYLNYGLAVLGIGVVFLIRQNNRRQSANRFKAILGDSAA